MSLGVEQVSIGRAGVRAAVRTLRWRSPRWRPLGAAALCALFAITGAAPAEAATAGSVPWRSVGAGWSAVVWRARSTAPGTLLLVSPTGARYRIASVPAETSVRDISPDGRRVVLVRFTESAATVTVVELRTGHSRSFTVPNYLEQVRFTRPMGRALLLSYGMSSDRIERRSLTGARMVTIATGVPVGSADVLPSLDGRYLLHQVAGGIAVQGNATGVLIRRLPAPKGQTCLPRRWWNATTAVVACTATGSALSQVWLYPLSGAPARQLTRIPADQGFGADTAWPTRAGTLLREPANCGPSRIGWLTSAGRMRPMTWPGLPNPAGAVPDVGAVVDSHAYLMLSDCSDPRAYALVRYDLAGHSARTLAGPGANGGTVSGYAVIDPNA